MNSLILPTDEGELYKEISCLRQSEDNDWIIGLLSHAEYSNYADIGCGSGNFMMDILSKNLVKNLAVGIEKSESRLNQTKKQLASIKNIRTKFYLSDILWYPQISEKFDLITMMSVLHWLYPNEKQVFSWIADHLNNNGIFCFTTYHPLDLSNGIGGTDNIVLEAFEKIGLGNKFPNGFYSIGTRTRSINKIEENIRYRFKIEKVESKMAVMKIKSKQQYIDYHIATFGDFYMQFVPSSKQNAFLNALGEIAINRMSKYNYVTNMEVRAWCCSV